MNRINLAALVGAGMLVLSHLPAISADAAVTEQEAQSIARDAYIYFYPLVTMDVTRKQLTNVEPGKGIGAPMNNLFNVPTFPTADMKQVVRPNFDTLYSFGFADLTKEPMVVSVPDTDGRYYLLPMPDMWTDVICVARLAHDGNASGQFPRHATALERNRTGRIYANRSAHSLRLDHWSHQN